MELPFPIPGAGHVAEAVQRLVEAADPLRIIVFGSVARGEATPDSDLDLLVFMPDGVDRKQSRRDLRYALIDLGVAKDVVVTTPEHAALTRDSCWHIVGIALREGRVVYERPLR